MVIFVLDASAIINTTFLPDGKKITTSLVQEEIKDVESKLLFEGSDIEIRDPSKESIDKIRKLIKEKNKPELFSEPDISVLALALEIRNEKPTIVTDDYDIQNISKLLKIKFKTILFDGVL